MRRTVHAQDRAKKGVAALVASGATAALMWGCLGLTADVASPEHIVAGALAEHVAGAHYRALVDATAVLEDTARGFCVAPSTAGLTQVRDAWWQARSPWKRAEVVYFGPVVTYPERLGPKLDDWPVHTDAVEALYLSEASVADEAFAQMGTATRGFPVVEYLLWSEGALEALGDPRRCQMLVGAAADVHDNALWLESTWREAWVPQLSDPSRFESDYADAQEVVDEWVNRMAFTLENIRTTKLGVPAGDDADGRPQPDTLESRYSQRSLQDAQEAFAGVQDLWTGEVAEGRVGIRDLLVEPTDVETVEAAFATAEAALEAIPEPLEAAIVTHQALIVEAQLALEALQRELQTTVAAAIGVRLAFNDADGD